MSELRSHRNGGKAARRHPAVGAATNARAGWKPGGRKNCADVQLLKQQDRLNKVGGGNGGGRPEWSNASPRSEPPGAAWLLVTFAKSTGEKSSDGSVVLAFAVSAVTVPVQWPHVWDS